MPKPTMTMSHRGRWRGNSVMHSDIFKLREIGLKANRTTDLFLGLQVALYIKINILVSTLWRSNLEPMHR